MKRHVPVCSIDLSSDDKLIAAGAYDGAVLIWDLNSGVQIARLPSSSADAKVAFTPDGRTLISGCSDGVLTSWSTATWTSIQTVQAHDAAILKLIPLGPDRRVVSVSADRSIKIIDCADGRCHRTLRGHTGEVNSAAVSPD
jgi:WD40 repeat protein